MSTVQVVTKTQQITVDPVTSAVAVTSAGPQGPPGTGSGTGSGASLNFTQASALSVWTINHNFGFKPSVQTYSVGGAEVIGEIHHISNNQVQITFVSPMSGSARLV